MQWSLLGSFNANAWNKVGLQIDPLTRDLSLYLNDVLLADDLGTQDENPVTRLHLESGTAGGQHIYVDSIALYVPDLENFDSYTASESLDEKSGGSNDWGSSWSLWGGDVTVSTTQAQSGANSIDFGATSSDVVARALSLEDGYRLQLYVYAASSTDALLNIELRSANGFAYGVRFNYLSAGHVRAYDGSQAIWSDLGTFTADAWNKVEVEIVGSTISVYLDDVQIGSDLGQDGDPYTVSQVILESGTANSQHIYVDSMQRIRP
jgi:hypothetical protein